MADPRFEHVKSTLIEEREKLQRRLRAIQKDRRHVNAPLDPDSGEQAVERENDEALDALDIHGRERLDAIDAALRRLAEGSYGTCGRCGEPIAARRLEVRPAATTCVDCADPARDAN